MIFSLHAIAYQLENFQRYSLFRDERHGWIEQISFPILVSSKATPMCFLNHVWSISIEFLIIVESQPIRLRRTFLLCRPGIL